MAKQFRDFESARKFVRELGLKNYKEWQEYCKSGDKPEDIPRLLSECENNKSEKILAYDVERREWEDIEVSSIKKWKKLENGVL